MKPTWACLLALSCLLVPIGLRAGGVETVEISNVQFARSPSAVLIDPSGSPIDGAVAEEFSADWKQTLRSTRTDASGAFTMAPVKHRKLYYIFK
jgi:hypothetical protein